MVTYKFQDVTHFTIHREPIPVKTLTIPLYLKNLTKLKMNKSSIA